MREARFRERCTVQTTPCPCPLRATIPTVRPIDDRTRSRSGLGLLAGLLVVAFGLFAISRSRGPTPGAISATTSSQPGPSTRAVAVLPAHGKSAPGTVAAPAEERGTWSQGEASIAGVVVDYRDSPVVKFGVVLHRVDDGSDSIPPPKSERTFDAGTNAFVLRGLIAGTYKVAPVAAGMVGREEKVTLTASEQRAGLVLTLVATSWIRGEVVDAANGRPVAGARIEVRRTDEQGIERAIVTTVGGEFRQTAVNGLFEVLRVPSGIIRVHVTHDEYVPADSESVILEDNHLVDIPTVAMTPGGVVVGVVLTAEGLPLPHVLVESEPAPAEVVPPTGTWYQRTVMADEQARFRVGGLRPGKWTFSAKQTADGSRATGFSTLPDDLVPRGIADVIEGTTTSVEVRAPRVGCTITGALSRAGLPLSDWKVSLAPVDIDRKALDSGHRETTTDKNGRFVLKNARPGASRINYAPRAAAPGSWSWSPTTDVVVPSIAQHSLTVDLPPSGTLRGQVTRRGNGQAVSGAYLALSPISGDQAARTFYAGKCSTNDEGRYEFTGLEDGSYLVTVMASRVALGDERGSLTVGATYRVAEVRNASIATLDIAVDAGRSVLVEVTDADNHGMGGVGILVMSPAAASNGSAWMSGGVTSFTMTNTNGQGIAPGISSGRWIVAAMCDQSVEYSNEFDVAANGDSTVRMRVPARVPIQIHADAGLPRGTSARVLDERSRFVSLALPKASDLENAGLEMQVAPGAYRLVVQVPDRAPIHRDIVVSPQGDHVFKIELPKDDVRGDKR